MPPLLLSPAGPLGARRRTAPRAAPPPPPARGRSDRALATLFFPHRSALSSAPPPTHPPPQPLPQPEINCPAQAALTGGRPTHARAPHGHGRLRRLAARSARSACPVQRARACARSVGARGRVRAYLAVAPLPPSPQRAALRQAPRAAEAAWRPCRSRCWEGRWHLGGSTTSPRGAARASSILLPHTSKLCPFLFQPARGVRCGGSNATRAARARGRQKTTARGSAAGPPDSANFF